MAKQAYNRWQGWAVRGRSDTEWKAARRRATRDRSEKAAVNASTILEAIRGYAQWLTIDDIGVITDLDRLAVEEGCDLLVTRGDVERLRCYVQSVGQTVTVVRTGPGITAGSTRAGRISHTR